MQLRHDPGAWRGVSQTLRAYSGNIAAFSAVSTSRRGAGGGAATISDGVEAKGCGGSAKRVALIG